VTEPYHQLDAGQSETARSHTPGARPGVAGWQRTGRGGYHSGMPLDVLGRLHGSWQAIYQLRGDPAFESDSTSVASVLPVLGGRFVRIDYTWSERDKLQEGSLLIGFEPTPGRATVAWIDSWHNGRKMMLSEGVLTADGGIDVRGTYHAGPGLPDWGWRTRLEVAADTWAMTMLNVSPDGYETVAVRAEYGRA